MIDARWGVYPYEPIAGEQHACGRIVEMVRAKAGDHANRMKAAGSRSVVIRSSSRGPWRISKFNLLVLSCPTQRSFAGGIALIKIAFEACRRRLGFCAYEGHPLGRCSLPSRDMLELRQPLTNFEKALPRISFER